jgi:hypothetical protein
MNQGPSTAHLKPQSAYFQDACSDAYPNPIYTQIVLTWLGPIIIYARKSPKPDQHPLSCSFTQLHSSAVNHSQTTTSINYKSL